MPERGPIPAEQLEQLTSLYERQAYVVWNVSLRTTLARGPALDAARRAFLGQVDAPDEPRLAADAARLAAELSEPVDPRLLDDPVLAASACLAPAQRAVFALGTLAGGTGAFGLDESAEQEVRRRGLEQLATLLAVSAAEAEDAYADMPWEDPPEELWHTLYPELHAVVTKRARAEQVEAAVVEPVPVRSRGRSVPHLPRAALVPVAVLAIAGVAWAASGGGSGSDSGSTAALDDSGSGAPVLGDSGGSNYSSEPEKSGGSAPALTAEELDQLRQEEIEDLKRFTARKEDRSLPPRQRRRAARKVGDLVKLAQARQRAAERRELALRRALARERAARMREEARGREEREEDQPEQRSPTPAPQPQPTEPPQTKPRDRDEREDEAPANDQAECLYDEGSGAYICPE